MNVRCPQCQSTFRVDPERVPAGGIKARCSRCSNVFEITREGAQAAPPPSGPKLVPTSPPAEPAIPRALPTPPPPAPLRPVAASAPVAAVVTAPPPAPAPTAPAAAVSTATAPKRASFRNQDPAARAQRLARALVSDIVAYNKERLQKTTGAAALRTEFRDEIRKSWEEYVEQVGLETAKATPYFRDALNELLAKGAKIF